LRFIPVKTPFFIRWFYPKYIWKKPTDKKIIYLTFDDGPTPKITSWVLDQLKTRNAKATFFCIGSNIESNPELFQRIQKEGHIIGNHTNTHIKGWKTSTKTYLKEAEITEQTIETNSITNTKAALNKKERLFRPPYGQITNNQGRQLRKKGYNIIMWSVLTFDWENTLTKEKCLKNSLKTKSGDIIVFHDSVKASKNLQFALPQFLKYYSEKGYEFKTL
jgi:peptidoglycan/xylan/chitin deacetylase (PgdA/CDA1 family)